MASSLCTLLTQVVRYKSRFIGTFLRVGRSTSGCSDKSWIEPVFESRTFFNARRMRTRVMVLCYQSTAGLRPLCKKVNIPSSFSLNFHYFQLRNFAKMLSVTSYICILSFYLEVGHFFHQCCSVNTLHTTCISHRPRALEHVLR